MGMQSMLVQPLVVRMNANQLTRIESYG